ncbi:MAG TPA: DUF1189 family protein [Candidatus Baltobacteraceae bacterium]|nr:DUF1189 family protein [Candidatus Baltobacteraceae bacterium]
MNAFFNWIAQWARTAYEAATRIGFYRRVGSRKTGEAFGHLAMLAVLWTLPITVLFFMGLRLATGRLVEGLRSDIPPGTVFEMKKGHLTNNLQAPLVFHEADAVVIINTATTTLALKEGENGVVIDGEAIVQQDGPKRETTSFHDLPDFRFGREELMEKIVRWAPFALFIVSLLVLIFAFLAFWVGIILNALLHGFALWLLLKLIKRPRPWREAFVAAAYAATASTLLRLAVQGIGPLAALPDIVYWGYVAWIAYDAYKGGPHERKEAAPADGPRTEGKPGPV